MKIFKWKTNGKKSMAHVFINDPHDVWGGTAICGAKIPAFFSVDSLQKWEVKRVSCPKCKARR